MLMMWVWRTTSSQLIWGLFLPLCHCSLENEENKLNSKGINNVSMTQLSLTVACHWTSWCRNVKRQIASHIVTSAQKSYCPDLKMTLLSFFFFSLKWIHSTEGTASFPTANFLTEEECTKPLLSPRSIYLCPCCWSHIQQHQREYLAEQTSTQPFPNSSGKLFVTKSHGTHTSELWGPTRTSWTVTVQG